MYFEFYNFKNTICIPIQIQIFYFKLIVKFEIQNFICKIQNEQF